MNFRYKCLLQSIFSILPHGEEFNYFAQKHISKKLPPSRQHYESKKKQALLHHEIFSKYGNNDKAVVYEIGCGWTLAMALIFSGLGYSNIKALDVTKHARVELINKIISYLKDDKLISHEVMDLIPSCNIKERFKDFKIDYLAPCDSTATGLPENSIDFVYSQECFEHIPAKLLAGVMNECHRLLKKGGIASFSIDYSDHYCSVDKSITAYNFLRYSSEQWKKYNPGLHYVNRLRHIDFIRLFESTHFEIVDVATFQKINFQQIADTFPFANEFLSQYSLDELSITGANIVLRKI